MVDSANFDECFPKPLQQTYIERLIGRVGLTRRRAECFVRLCAYLWLKEQESINLEPQVPIQALKPPKSWVVCTCEEAAQLFYSGRERGSKRSAAMMLDKLKALNLLQKRSDGNTLNLKIPGLPELLEEAVTEVMDQLTSDAFKPERDTIHVAQLLESNYQWMNTTAAIVPLRIAGLLRDWAAYYSKGMRVLRRLDNGVPVGFYLLYPTTRKSEEYFFRPASMGLHLSGLSDQDPFELAQPGDTLCRSVFVRSWMIDERYRDESQAMMLKDAQKSLKLMQQDFPNLWDMYTLVIHLNYENLARYLGFQKITTDSQSSMYWAHLAIATFLERDIPDQLPWMVT
ncbi:MAG: hypothetical protein AAGB19_14710 [Cyanobacteria bacterium P01_F01_bin.3]